jgi:hypothetical protein
MSQTIELSAKVQKAILQLNALLKEKEAKGYNDEVEKLRLLKELLEEQDLGRHARAASKTR